MVRFKFSSIGSEKIVIGLVGLLIFHPIIQPTSNSHVWNNLRDASKCFDLNELTSRIHRNMRIVVPENVDDEFELTNPLTYGIEVERVETDELINDFTADESLTMSQFIDRFSSISEEGQRIISRDVYTSSVAVNLLAPNSPFPLNSLAIPQNIL